MGSRAWTVAPLLFISGISALVYQVVWLRQLRLVFGSSTASSAAVLAVFMAGLGLGSAFLGRLADRSARPLRLYGVLELLVGATALLTPFLLDFFRSLYISLGGVAAMGLPVATLVRLLSSTVILGVPTFLMGGTLPAIVREVETDGDQGRRRLGLLYGINTLGAVIGVAVAIFYMLELFGSRNSLWLACICNLMVGLAALTMASRGSPSAAPAATLHGLPSDDEQISLFQQLFLYAAGGILGFSFFLMELVWYRMLVPLLGGSTYTFGHILAVALFGIGVGGVCYSLGSRGRRTSFFIFAFTCGLEALFIAIPYALGDRIAVFAALLRPLANIGFCGHILGWTVIASIVVLPAAVISGFQFPLLIGLLGQGRRDVGRHTGFMYACNTLGAILGSLAGGFGLLPLLSAPGCWKAVSGTLALLGLAAAVIALRKEKKFAIVPQLCIVIGSFALLFAEGPTAVWRHSHIGAGWADLANKGYNEIRNWMQATRRGVIWETEGIESGIAVTDDMNGLSFLINGRSDGTPKIDVPTMVMGPLIGAILHPDPRSAMVIGLGSGASAGWLGRIETMAEVDVIEFESSIVEVARRCSAVNSAVLENPKVQIIIGDGREALMTSAKNYDIIFSEPSNPYRAGISSFYTLEFYSSVKKHLKDNGIFLQWMQGYEVDAPTVHTIYATLAAVFPVVSVWETKPDDLLFVCSLREPDYSARLLRERIKQEPYRTALARTWKTDDLEGLLARFVASSSLAPHIAEHEAGKKRINTDDRMLVEYGFARTLGKTGLFAAATLRQAAVRRGYDRPPLTDGRVDWARVLDNYAMMYAEADKEIPGLAGLSAEQGYRLAAYSAYMNNDRDALALWLSQPRQPDGPFELAMAAEGYADIGDETALPFIEELRAFSDLEADVILSRYLWRRGDRARALKELVGALLGLRSDPWPSSRQVAGALSLALEMAGESREVAEKLFELLSEPFSLRMLNNERINALYALTTLLDEKDVRIFMNSLEPHVPWHKDFLERRADCYWKTGDPLAGRAARDLLEYRNREHAGFGALLFDDSLASGR